MGKRSDEKGLAAATLAAKGSQCRVRMGCYCAGNALPNIDKTHPALRKYGYPEHANVHAELNMVIHNAAWNVSFPMGGETVYVARLTKAGRRALARPCRVCMAVLVHMDVKRVVWTIDDDSHGEIKL